MKYSILIQWSDSDQAYIASLPEWGDFASTHGDTYEEALENAREVLEDLIHAYEQTERPLPLPKILQAA
ncbi:MAG: type II toxin-antitoxin system HicB family antitoxin [Thermosynechococcaceae cyanobacterium]